MITDKVLTEFTEWLQSEQDLNPRVYKKLLLDILDLIEFQKGIISDQRSDSGLYSQGMQDGVEWVIEYLRNTTLRMTCEPHELPNQVVVAGHLVALGIEKAWKERE